MSAGRTISTNGRDAWSLGVSAVVHAVVLGWGVMTFTGKPPITVSAESLPVDIVSVSEFTQLTSGSKNAIKVEAAKPLADKVGERTEVDDPTAKVAKKAVHAATDEETPPLPEPKPPSPPEKQRSEPKPEKQDPIAEAIKKDLAKKPEPKKPEPKKAEAKTHKKSKADDKTQHKKEPPKFDPRKVEALLDKRTPQRLAATGDVINSTIGLGAPTGTAEQLSQSELAALIALLGKLWSPPTGASNPDELVVVINLRLKPDGTLAAPPGVVSFGRSAISIVARDRAVRAVLRGQPFTMLRPEHYETWKELEIRFDPRDMIRG
jgi:outer membrane biosynthesis protein TonB